MTDFSNVTLATFNTTLLHNSSHYCTLATCPLVIEGIQLANFTYIPNLPGNLIYAGLFAIFLVAQIILGIRHKTTGYTIGLTIGLFGEVVGYIGRIMLHSNPFLFTNFITYLVSLTIAPAFLTAGIYLCLSRIVVIYSESHARFSPKTYTHLFVLCDFISLALQGAGGGIAATAPANKPSASNLGKNLLIAGLSFQVVSLTLFIALGLDLFSTYRRFSIPFPSSANDEPFNPNFATLRSAPKFKHFLFGLGVATVLIYVRSIFRVAELSKGFHSPIANSEVDFMILEGLMVVVACGFLTVLHPGLVMGTEGWKAAGWKNAKNEQEKAAGKFAA